jgi:uncharacterized GH25 family protein
MRKSLLILLAFAFVLGSSLLSAHDLWTTADKPEAGKPLSLVVGYGHAYPAWEAIPDDEYGLFKTKIVGPNGDLATSPGSPNYIWTSSAPVAAGTYLAITNVDPVFWSKTPEGWSMKPKNESPGAVSCERAIENAKGIVVVGSGGSDSAVTKAAGLPLEIVPAANPSSIKAGEKLSLTVLFNGKPLPAAKVTARYAGFDKLAGASASAYFSPTDKDGKVSFVPLVPGEWLVTVRNDVPFSDLAVCDKDSYGTSLHFDVK